MNLETFLLVDSDTLFPPDVCWDLQAKPCPRRKMDGGVGYPCPGVKCVMLRLQTEAQTLGHAVLLNPAVIEL